ncbi:hypothetical protein H3146_25675 [Streptomyces sp. OF3]|uniref:Uncharacterized protein n=1 Tax=Streptomyces alkaliterrae TaxID=2213162 RepID=A0A7W3WQR2_9ACTN|nr:hypothetical protein [Streptomyces alkaliterrae]MBB1256709.1 hypothetical protein [Streptomyces alkaliterrae]
MGYRHSRNDPGGDDTGRRRESGLEHARREASRLADYLQFGPPRSTGDQGRPPQLVTGDWDMPEGTLSVYAIGRALVLRGTFTEGDLRNLRKSFSGQLVTLDSDGEQHTVIVWPPEEGDDTGGGASDRRPGESMTDDWGYPRSEAGGAGAR